MNDAKLQTIDVTNEPYQSVDVLNGPDQTLEVQQDVVIINESVDKDDLMQSVINSLPKYVGETNITIDCGESVHLSTAGKYCEQDIIITAEDGGATEENLLDARLTGTLKGIDSQITSVTNYACYGLSSLITVNLPNVTTLGNQSFRGCTKMTTFNAPNLTSMGSYSFYTDSSLVTISLPLLKTITDNCFGICSKLTKADFGAVQSIEANAFARCSVLTALILRKADSIATLSNTNAFTSTPIASGTGFIYVPSALVDSYKAASNWSTYASRIRAIEDYPDICG